MSLQKIHLMTQPTQSGKTTSATNTVSDQYPILTDDSPYDAVDYVHIFFNTRNNAQTTQLKLRLDMVFGISSILTSTKRFDQDCSDYPELVSAIMLTCIRMIVCCFDGRQIEKIEKFIDAMKFHRTGKHMKFVLWVDEADALISNKKNKTLMLNFADKSNVEALYLITATPVLLEQMFPESYMVGNKNPCPDVYVSFSECQFEIINSAISENNVDIELHHIQYVQKVISGYKENIKNGQVFFIPAEKSVKSHIKTKDFLIKQGFNVFVLDGIHKKLFMSDGEIIDIEKISLQNNVLLQNSNKGTPLKNMQPAEWLGIIYKNYNLDKKIVAITGKLCVDRGITINSKDMLITHQILFGNSGSEKAKDTLYQLAGRVNGNYKHFMKQKPVIFTTETIKKIIYEREKGAIDKPKKAYELSKDKGINKEIVSVVISRMDCNRDTLREQLAEINKGKTSTTIDKKILKYIMENPNCGIDDIINCIGDAQTRIDRVNKIHIKYNLVYNKSDGYTITEQALEEIRKSYPEYINTDELFTIINQIILRNSWKKDILIHMYRNKNSSKNDLINYLTNIGSSSPRMYVDNLSHKNFKKLYIIKNSIITLNPIAINYINENKLI